MNKFIHDIKKYHNYTIYSAKSELKAEVANSYLNWVWWVLEPLCFMGVYTLIFGYFFKASEPYFTVYIFIGITVWDFFNKMVKSSVKLVKSNKPIVSKVYVPKYILIIEKMMVNGFKMSIGFAITAFLMLINRVPVSWNILWLIPILLCLILVTFGICSIVLHFGVYIEDLANLLNIVLRLMFYLTGVFYNLEKRAGEIGVYLNQYNPLAFLINAARDALIYCKMPNLLWVSLWLIIGMILSAVGIRLIQKNENSYVKVI